MEKETKNGSIAQLVQSVCLTSRGSGVRLPLLPPPESSYIVAAFFVYDSILPQEGLEVKQCFDINYGVEGGVLIGQYNEGYASMLPDGADPDKSYIAMVMGPDEFVSDTPDADKTSGTVIYKTDLDTDGTAEAEVTLEYANLTENSVDITYNDPMSGSAIKVSCTVAPEGTKVYTYADLM